MIETTCHRFELYLATLFKLGLYQWIKCVAERVLFIVSQSVGIVDTCSIVIGGRMDGIKERTPRPRA